MDVAFFSQMAVPECTSCMSLMWVWFLVCCHFISGIRLQIVVMCIVLLHEMHVSSIQQTLRTVQVAM